MNQTYFSPLLNPALDSIYLQSFQPSTYDNGTSRPQFTHNALLRSRTIYTEMVDNQRSRETPVFIDNYGTVKYNSLNPTHIKVQNDKVQKNNHNTVGLVADGTEVNQLAINSEASNQASMKTSTQITRNQEREENSAVHQANHLQIAQDSGNLENKRKAKKKNHECKPAEIITYDEHQKSIKNSPPYFLGLFLDLDIINWLIAEATENGRDMKNFTQPTEEEIRCFIAILYLSGYIDVPRRRMLWERSPDTHCPLVSNAMQRDRFESIFTTLHAGDNMKDNLERLNKIRPLIDKLNMKFLQNSPLDDQHSIAENSIPSSGRHHNAKGPGKSLRVWCGCTKSGYCVYFTPLQVNDNTCLGQSVILHYARLMSHYNSSLRSLLFENTYSESRFIGELQKLGIQAVGTDREKDGCLLNPTLGGVDRLECNLGLYRTSIKRKKSYSVLLTFCLDLALNNAWHLYRNVTQAKKPLDLLGFRRSIVIYYLEHYAKPILAHKGGRPAKVKSMGKRHPPSDARFDGIRHFVIPQEKQTRCCKCAAKTTTRCQKCDVGVHVKCFVEFHTRPRENCS